MERRLAAIPAADVAGYSRLMERDEAGTFERLRAHRKELFEPEIDKHHGRIFKLMGDGLLAEFGSVVDAIECAVALQRGMATRNEGVPAEQRIEVRIGINLGDVIIEGKDRHGEGVNIAARLQELAEPGGIAISRQAYDQVESKLKLAFEDLGERSVKNIAKPVHVYLVREGANRVSRRWHARRLSRVHARLAALVVLVAVAVWYLWPEGYAPTPGPKIAVLPFTIAGGAPCNEDFSNRLAQDIGAALLKFSEVSVIAGGSNERVTGENLDAGEFGYKLDGAIECSAGGLYVSAQLFDAAGKQVAMVVQDASLSAEIRKSVA
jgi:class 3 adenylate cyclase